MNPAKDLNLIWYGPVYTATGYGSVSRYYLLELIRAGIRVKIVPFGPPEKDKIDSDEVQLLERAEKTELDSDLKNIVILHSTPSGWKNVTIKGADYIIGMTIFEPAAIPKNWVRICNASWIDKIWLPTKFNIETFSKSGVDKSKIDLVHYCIDTTKYRPISYSDENKRFRFTYIADFSPRKNLLSLINAFCNEFGPEDPVELFIHTTSGNMALIENFINENKGLLGNRGNVIVNTTKMTGQDIVKLMASSNVYVSVDKANGWGMPCMEAMALGKLAITVDWSGSTEFMFKSNSLLIEPSGLEVVDAESALNQPYYIGQKWAKVETDTIGKVLKNAYSNWDALEEVRRSGRRDVIEMLDAKVVVRDMISKLNRLDFDKKSKRQFVIYRDPVKMAINQIEIMVGINFSYLKTYHSLKLAARILSRWLRLKPIFY